MSENRRLKRLELNSKVVARNVVDNTEVEYEIDVIDITKKGVGFSCKKALNIGGVYEGYFRIWTKDVIHAFFEIVRIEKMEDTIKYGATFVGMPSTDTMRIDIYEMFEDNKEE